MEQDDCRSAVVPTEASQRSASSASPGEKAMIASTSEPSIEWMALIRSCAVSTG
jgi:hypothetical protein